MPITPLCQLSPAITSTGFERTDGFSCIIFSTSSNISFSHARLRWFSVSRAWAISLAMAGVSHMSSSTAVFALPILPAAFIRGAIPNAIEPAFKSFIPATSRSAEIPGVGRDFMDFMPRSTITLFSSVSDTTSATVPIAAYGAYL